MLAKAIANAQDQQKVFDAIKNFPQRKTINKMTNFEVIKALNEKQMVDFLAKVEIGDIDFSKTFCDLCNGKLYDCDECKAWWLDIDAYKNPQGLQFFEDYAYKLDVKVKGEKNETT